MWCRIHNQDHRGKKAKARCYIELCGFIMPNPDLKNMYSTFRQELGNLTFGSV